MKMTPERWRQIDTLLESVLELPHTQRVAMVEESCKQDPVMRREVLALLAADADSDGFLEKPSRQVQRMLALLGQRIR